MTDPARQERIDIPQQWTRPRFDYGHYYVKAAKVALELADAIEPRPVYLTAEERAALLRAAAEVFAAVDPRLALSEEGQALNDASRKLKTAEEKS